MAPSVLFLRFKPQEFKAFFQTAGEVNSSICKTSDQLDHNGGQAEAGQVAPHQKKKKTVILVQKLIGALPSLTVSRRGTNSSLDFQS
jgi:hypothetical protein